MVFLPLLLSRYNHCYTPHLHITIKSIIKTVKHNESEFCDWLDLCYFQWYLLLVQLWLRVEHGKVSAHTSHWVMFPWHSQQLYKWQMTRKQSRSLLIYYLFHTCRRPKKKLHSKAGWLFQKYFQLIIKLLKFWKGKKKHYIIEILRKNTKHDKTSQDNPIFWKNKTNF